MESCKKVLTNMDLLTLIFKHLDFEDQLRLALVNDQLRYAFEVLSGNVNYSSLGIYQDNLPDGRTDAIFVATEMGVNRKYLQSEQALYDFVEIYADRVQDLMLWKVEVCLCQTILRKFRNLRTLSTYRINIENWKLYELAQLQELNVVDCCGNAERIVDGIVRKMKNLHKLEIFHTNILSKDRATNHNILSLYYWPKLTSFKLTICWCAAICGPVACNLKQLNINLVDVECLKQLPLSNLKVLHLQLYKDADKLFPILTESCANLESLTLTCVKFINLTTLLLPPKVTELTFFGCTGLTHSCLKRILTEFRIIKFCSKATQYIGEFHDFQISSHIQSLEVSSIEMAKFKSAYENNSQLKEFIWHHRAGETRDVSFNRTPNLQRLEIPYISAVTELTQLNSLHTLKLKCSDSLIKWCYVVNLLKHPSLRELSIWSGFHTSLKFLPSVLPVISLQTNIARITIAQDILQAWMKFWLELFSTNMQMTLVCLLTTNDLKLAKELVEHENFPKRLKTMDVSCFTIDCEELRRSFVAVSNKYPIIHRDTPYIYRKVKMARRKRIVLSWKYEFNF